MQISIFNELDCHFTLLACWKGATQQGLGTGKRAKQFSKQITRQIEFSDAFKTKIGSCPVQAANNFLRMYSYFPVIRGRWSQLW